MKTGLHMNCFARELDKRVPFELGSDDVWLFLLSSEDRNNGPAWQDQSYLGELAYRCSDCEGGHNVGLFDNNPQHLLILDRVVGLGLPLEFRKDDQLPVIDSWVSNGQMDLWATTVDELYEKIVDSKDTK